MSDRIALQLYTVRDVASKDYESAVRKVAEMGYRAVETAGFPGTTPQQAARLFNELGIKVVAAHAGMPLGDAKNQILETMDALGRPRLICPGVNRDYFKSVDGVKALCGLLNESNQIARQNGMEFGFHNHDVEYGKVEGQYIYKLMKENLDPGVFFELDTYWIQVAGVNPAEIVQEMGLRAPLLHIKDGPADAANRDAPMTAVGEGVVDVKSILAASGSNALYWIVEMDRVAGDSMEEARKSYDYLKGIQL